MTIQPSITAIGRNTGSLAEQAVSENDAALHSDLSEAELEMRLVEISQNRQQMLENCPKNNTSNKVKNRILDSLTHLER